jgi:hypothetical protein
MRSVGATSAETLHADGFRVRVTRITTAASASRPAQPPPVFRQGDPVFTSRSAARRAAVLAASLLLLPACAREDAAPDTSAPAAPAAPAAPSGGASGDGGAVDFGTAKAVCGPGTGTPPPSDAKGVSDSEINIGVLNDATNTIAPGLGAVYIDVAEAFTTWCNQQGGINGRTVVFTSRDAKLTEAAARVVDACQQDFMLVGGGTPFDAATVGARAGCGIGAIPAYVASDDNRTSPKQAVPFRAGNTKVNVGAFRLLETKAPGAFQATGVLATDNPSLLTVSDALREALSAADVTEVSYQKVPLGVTNYRTYVQPLAGKATAFLPPLGPSAELFRAMNDVGYEPEVILDPVGNTYNQLLVDALKAAPLDSPYYVATNSFPFDLADENPTLKQAIELTKATGTDVPVDGSIVSGWVSWLLWAQSATACTDNLTVDCVINGAKGQEAFDAGGMLAPRNVGDVEATTPCVAISTVTGDGFRYDRETTQPTDGVFNCDPANVVTAG